MVGVQVGIHSFHPQLLCQRIHGKMVLDTLFVNVLFCVSFVLCSVKHAFNVCMLHIYALHVAPGVASRPGCSVSGTGSAQEQS